jgi:type I restriction enzyme, S subunit
MDLPTFWDNFEIIAEAPGGIAKLRALILDLAVRGKLVPQDAKDEPAEKLLEAIKSQKKQLNQKQRTEKSDFPPIDRKEIEYEIPSSWLWARFGQITICRDGERIPLSKEQRSGRYGEYDYYGASGVIDKIDDYLFDKPLLLIGEDGANLINRSTPIAFIASGKYWVNNHAHVLDGLSYDCLRYLEVFINSIDLKPYVTGTAQPKMNQAKMNSIPVPLPPLTEQKRIVAKVDELMALCDRYEAAKATRDTLRQNLRKSVIDTLMNAPDDRALKDAWSIVQENWVDLSQEPEDVESLRKIVLELAIQGKLEPQNPKEQSAQLLLSEIQAEQDELIKSGRIKKESSLPQIPASPQPNIPKNWQRCYFQDLKIFGPRNGYSPKAVDYPTAVRSITLTATTSGKFNGKYFKYLDEVVAQDSYLWLQTGDLLIQRSNTLAYVGSAAVYEGK